MGENKKVINATSIKVNNIKFKSRIEASIYKYLLDNGYNPLYEPDTFVIFSGFYPTPYIIDGIVKKTKCKDITYTPDFKINIDNKTVYIEVKGFSNDVYPYKRKLFLSYIKSFSDIYFVEVHSKKGLLTSLKMIEDGKIT